MTRQRGRPRCSKGSRSCFCARRGPCSPRPHICAGMPPRPAAASWSGSLPSTQPGPGTAQRLPASPVACPEAAGLRLGQCGAPDTAPGRAGAGAAGPECPFRRVWGGSRGRRMADRRASERCNCLSEQGIADRRRFRGLWGWGAAHPELPASQLPWPLATVTAKWRARGDEQRLDHEYMRSSPFSSPRARLASSGDGAAATWALRRAPAALQRA